VLFDTGMLASTLQCCELTCAVSLPDISSGDCIVNSLVTATAAALAHSAGCWSLDVTVLLNGCDVTAPNLKPPVAFQLPALWKGCSTDGKVEKAKALFELVLKEGNGFIGAETAADDKLPAICTSHHRLHF